MESCALPNPLLNYDSELGNEQSDYRFYTSLGEQALFEQSRSVLAAGGKGAEKSRDSAYFTISFGDQEITSNSNLYGK